MFPAVRTASRGKQAPVAGSGGLLETSSDHKMILLQATRLRNPDETLTAECGFQVFS